ncbi:MAG: alanine racemase [Streptococcaceae bacterium]|jgi:alanine racemase|nr:alanine racemase [Streptococcaceae bacterium]
MKPALHRATRAIIDLAAIRGNLAKFIEFSKKPVWGVVKADGYGHGASEVSRAIEPLVSGFCVSDLDEALELREIGLTKPVLVLSGIPVKDTKLALENDITLTAPNQEWLMSLPELPLLSGLKLHIKVDSGMGRIGEQEPEIINQMIDFMDENDLVFDGIFTHFATADERDDVYYYAQLTAFEKILSELTRRPNYVHTSNSAAGLFHKTDIFDFVRLGAGLYGINPSGTEITPPFELTEALSLVSALTMVKKVPAGAKIGYGATYEALEETIVGTVPIGYADGLARVTTQGFHVLVDGQFCEIIGRVSMDQLTIKLPQIYKIGQPVTLMGHDGTAFISGQDWAARNETIHYEICTHLTERVPRFYLEN